MWDSIASVFETIGAAIAAFVAMIFVVFVFIFSAAAELVGYDTTEFWEGSPESSFGMLVTPRTEDVRIIEVFDYTGWIDPSIDAHFVASPETIDAIIEKREMKQVTKAEFTSNGNPFCPGGKVYPVEKWEAEPIEIIYYKVCKIRTFDEKEHSPEYISFLQHNKGRTEAFVSYGEY